MFTYFVRYLPPKQNGLGEIVYAISRSVEISLKDLKEEKPEVFSKPGFYSLLLAKDEQLTVGDNKS